MSLSYKPDGDTLKAFMKDDAFFRGLRGPVGSGKSVASCIEIFRRALAQEPDSNGKRKSRWAIIRNTNPQLKTTTIKTWLDWFPENVWGKFNWSPPFTHHIKKADLDMEVIFLALDRPEDVKKLLSLELTGVFINEAREVPKAIVDACTMRVGRYPSMKDGGPTWYGVIADTNAPDEDHWWPIMSGEVPLPDHIGREEALMLVKPANWNFYTQPGGMIEKKDKEGHVTGYELNPDAENQANLTPRYYPDIIQGKSKSWIGVYVLNKLGTLEDGKPVYKDYNEKMHLAEEPLMPVAGKEIVVGVDFGLTPAAAYMQNVRGRWLILGELVSQDMGATRFAQLLKQDMASRFPEHRQFKIYGDPAGDYRAQTDEKTPFMVFRAAGLKIYEAPTNDPALRIDAVTGVLTRMADGLPAFLLSPECKTLKRGFETGYQYKRLNVSGERYSDLPDKNKYSHVHDALQYGLCGGGESRKLLTSATPTKSVTVRRDHDVFARRQTKKRETGFTFNKSL